MGQSRGAAVTNYLLELNHDVRGDTVEESPETILAERPDFFRSFSVVVCCEITEKALKTLSTLLWDANIPLMVVRTVGFIGYIRLQIMEHCIIESHPDNELPDLRLDVPFPALVDFMETQDMAKMDKKQHMHTPYLVILYKCLQDWKESHGGEMPKNYREKKVFKELIQERVLKNADGVPEDEENFAEAVAAVNSSLHPTVVPDEITAIFEDEQCRNLTAKSNDFWVITRAIKEFVADTGYLPVRGSIPDMFSDSERYIRLHQVYNDKAAEDSRAVFKRVQDLLESVGRPNDQISEAHVKKFCKEAFHLRLVRGDDSLCDEMNGRSANKAEVINTFEREPESPLMFYYILKGSDRFFTEFNTLPGASSDDQVEPDITKLKKCTADVLAEHGLPASIVKDEFVHEVSRCGGTELHAMASILGGIAAQEAIKLITKQYVVANNLFIYSAMTSETITLKV